MGYDYQLTRFVFQRSLGFIYFIGFLIILNQFTALLGEKGILPTPLFLRRIEFWDSPSLFYFHFSDPFVILMAVIGFSLSILALSGLSESFGMGVSVLVWTLLWLIYL